MELASVYLYNRIPIDLHDISNQTFHSLKRNGWYTDTRTNKKFTMLNKRIEHESKWYRCIIRFEYNGMLEGAESYVLSMPCPFIVTECEPVESVSVASWKDIKTYHGPKLKNVMGLMMEGVPAAIVDEVITDLKENVKYN
jgi:hypothetical protein